MADRDVDNDVHVHGKALDRRTRTALTRLLSDLLPGYRLTSARRLAGGLWAHTHALRLESDEGAVRRLALRRYVRWEPSFGPDLDCVRHVAALTVLRQAGASVAAPVWSDPLGSVLGVPALLSSLLPGRSWLPFAGTRRGLEEVAQAMAGIHGTHVASRDLGDRDDFARRVRSAFDDGELGETLRDCPVRDDVLAALADGLENALAHPVALTHGDFHPGNVLFTGRGDRLRLTGVVDWDDAAWRPRAADVGYCRADLTVAFGPGRADELAAAYRRLAGHAADELAGLAWFDLLAAARCWDQYEQWLPAYHAFGMPDLTVKVMRERLLTFTVTALG